MSGHNATIECEVNFHHLLRALLEISKKLAPQYISMDDVARIRRAADNLEERALYKNDLGNIPAAQAQMDAISVQHDSQLFCKGSYALGTACGQYSRCKEERRKFCVASQHDSGEHYRVGSNGVPYCTYCGLPKLPESYIERERKLQERIKNQGPSFHGSVMADGPT